MLDEKLKSKITLADFLIPELNKTVIIKKTESQNIEASKIEAPQLKKLFRACDEFIDFFQQNDLVNKFSELYDDYCTHSLPNLDEAELASLDEILEQPINIKGEFDFEVAITLREFFIYIQNSLKELDHDDSYLQLIDLIGSGVFRILKVLFIKRAWVAFVKNNAQKFNEKTIAQFEKLITRVLDEEIQQRLGKWPDDFDFRSKTGKKPLPKTLETLSYKLIHFIRSKVNWKHKEAAAIKAYNELCPRDDLKIPEPKDAHNLPSTDTSQKRKTHQLLIKRLAFLKWKKEPKGSWNNPVTQHAKTRYVTTTIGDKTSENPLKAELMWVDCLNREVMSGSDLHLPIFEFIMNGSRSVTPTSPIKNGWQAMLNLGGQIYTPGDLSKIDQFDWLRLIVSHTSGINSVYPNLEEIYFQKTLEVTKNKEIEIIFSCLNKYIFNKNNDPTEKAILGLRICLSPTFQKRYPKDVETSINRCLSLWKKNKKDTHHPYDSILCTVDEDLSLKEFKTEHLSLLLKSIEFIKTDTVLFSESDHHTIIQTALETVKDFQQNFIFSLIDTYIKNHKNNDSTQRLSIALAACLSSSFQKHFSGSADQFLARLINPDGAPLILPDNSGPILKLILEALQTKKINLKQLSQLLQAASFVQANTNPHSKTGRRAIIIKKGDQNICLIDTRISDCKLRLLFDPHTTFNAISSDAYKLEDSTLHYKILDLLLPLRPNKTGVGLLKEDAATLHINAAMLKASAEELLKQPSPYCQTMGGWLYLQAQSLEAEAKIPKWLILALPDILNASTNPSRFLTSLDHTNQDISLSKILQKEIKNKPINNKKFYKTLINSLKETPHSYLINHCLYALLREDLDLNEKKAIAKTLYQDFLETKKFSEAKKIIQDSLSLDYLDANDVINSLSDLFAHISLLSEAQATVERAIFSTFEDVLIKALNSIEPTHTVDIKKLSYLIAVITNKHCLIEDSTRNKILELIGHHFPSHIHSSIIPYLIARKDYDKAAKFLQPAHSIDSDSAIHFQSFLSIASACSTCINIEITKATFDILKTITPFHIQQFKTAKSSYFLTESLKWLILQCVNDNDPQLALELLNTLLDATHFIDQSSTQSLWLGVCKKLLEQNKTHEVFQTWDMLNKKDLWKGIEQDLNYLSFYIPFLKALVQKDPESQITRKLLPTLHVEQIAPELQSSVIEIYIHQWEGMIANGKHESVKSAWQRPIGKLVPETTIQRLRLQMLRQSVNNGTLTDAARAIPEYLKKEKYYIENIHCRKEVVAAFINKLSSTPLSIHNFQNLWELLQEFLAEPVVIKELDTSLSYRTGFLNTMIQSGLASQAQSIFNNDNHFSEKQRIEFETEIICYLMKLGKVIEAHSWIKALLKIQKETPEIVQVLEAFIKQLLTKTHKNNFNVIHAEVLEELLSDTHLHALYKQQPSTLCQLYLEAINQLLDVRPSLGLRKTFCILESLLLFVFYPHTSSPSIKQSTAQALTTTLEVIEKARASSIPFRKEIFKLLKTIYSDNATFKPLKETCQLIPILEFNKAKLCGNQSVTNNWQSIVRTFFEEDVKDDNDFLIAEEAFSVISTPDRCYEGNEVASANLFRTLIESLNKRNEFQKTLKIVPSFLSYKVASATSFSANETHLLFQALRATISTGPYKELILVFNKLEKTSLAHHSNWRPLLLNLHYELMKKKDHINAAHLLLDHPSTLQQFLDPIFKCLLDKKELVLCYELLKSSKTNDISNWFPFVALMQQIPMHPVTKEAVKFFIKFKSKPSEDALQAWIYALDILRHDPHSNLGALFLDNPILKSFLTHPIGKNTFEFSFACLQYVTEHISLFGHANKSHIGLRLFELKNKLIRDYSSTKPNIEEILLPIDLLLIKLIDSEHPVLFSTASQEYIQPYINEFSLDGKKIKLVSTRIEALVSSIATMNTPLSAENFKILLDLHNLGEKYSLAPTTRLKLLCPLMNYATEPTILNQFITDLVIDFPDVIDPGVQSQETSPQQKLIAILIIFLYKELDKINSLEAKDLLKDNKLLVSSANQLLKLAVLSLHPNYMSLVPWLLCHQAIIFILAQEDICSHTAGYCYDQLSESGFNVLNGNNIYDKSSCSQVIIAIINFVESYRSFNLSKQNEEKCLTKIKALLGLFIRFSKSNEIISLLDYLKLGMQQALPHNLNRYLSIYLTIIDLLIDDLLDYKNGPSELAETLVVELQNRIEDFFNDEYYHKSIIPLIKKLVYITIMSEKEEQIKAINTYIQNANNLKIFKDNSNDLLEIFILFTSDPSQLAVNKLYQIMSSIKRKELIFSVIKNFIDHGSFATLKRAGLLLSHTIVFFEKNPSEVLPLTMKLLDKFQSTLLRDTHKYYLFSNFHFPTSLKRDCKNISSVNPIEKKTYYRVLNEVQLKYLSTYYDFIISLPQVHLNHNEDILFNNHCEYIQDFLTTLYQSQQNLQRTHVNTYLEILLGIQIILEPKIFEILNHSKSNDQGAINIKNFCSKYLQATKGDFFTHTSQEAQEFRLKVVMEWLTLLSKISIYDRPLCEYIQELLQEALKNEVITATAPFYLEAKAQLEKYLDFMNTN